MCVCVCEGGVGGSVCVCVSVIDDGGRYHVQGLGLIISCFEKSHGCVLAPVSVNVLQMHFELFSAVSVAIDRDLVFTLPMPDLLVTSQTHIHL